MRKALYSILIIKRIWIYSLFFLCLGSCNNRYEKPPEAVVVTPPSSVSEKTKPGEYFLLLLLKKDNTFWFKYDTIENEENLKKITPYTTASIVKALDNVEKEYHVNLKETEKNILFKADVNLPYSSFKILKDALKQKEIFRFRIVTTKDN